MCCSFDGPGKRVGCWLRLFAELRSSCFMRCCIQASVLSLTGWLTPSQFSDIVHFQTLFSSEWPAATISDAATNGGNTGSTWNYGSNFGGPTRAGWTSGADTVHGGAAEGMFGSFGVEDDNYGPTLCPGTAGSVCKG
jgi:hypothetical protein